MNNPINNQPTTDVEKQPLPQDVPLWQQTVQRTLDFEAAQYDKVANQKPDPNAATQQTGIAPPQQNTLSKEAEDVVTKLLANKGMGVPADVPPQSKPPEVQQTQDPGLANADMSTTKDPYPGATLKGKADILGYGLYKGTSQDSLMSHIHQWLVTNHPAVAAEMGLSANVDQTSRIKEVKNMWKKPSVLKTAMELVLAGGPMNVGVATAERFMFGELAPSRIAVNQLNDTMAKVTMSEKQYTDWSNKRMEDNFGKDWMSITPEQRRTIMKQRFDKDLANTFPDVYGTSAAESTYAHAAEFTGAMVDPSTIAPIPGIRAGKTGWMAASLMSSGIAGSDAMMYDLAKEGKINPAHVGLAMTIGAALPPVLHYVAGGAGRFVIKYGNQKAMNKMLDRYEQVVLENRKRGVAVGQSANMARARVGLTGRNVVDLYEATGRHFNHKITPEDAITEVENRASWWQRNQLLTKVGKNIETWAVPITTRIAKLSPKIFQNMRVMDAATHIRAHLWHTKAEPFLQFMEKVMSKDDAAALHLALSGSDNKAALELVRKYSSVEPNGVKMLKDMRRALHDVYAHYKAMGYQFDYVHGYFPRIWKDPTRMADVDKGLFNQIVSRKSKQVGGRALTAKELEDAIHEALTASERAPFRAKTAAGIRKRSVEDLTPYLMKNFYVGPREAITSYFRAAAHDIERARFIRSFGYNGKFDTFGSDLGTRVEEIVRIEAHRLGWEAPQMQEMIKMLRARLVEGEMNPARWASTMKNFGYITTLGNVMSTLTQLSDNAFSFFKYGIHDTAQAALGGLVGKRELTKAMMGLTDAVEELYANTSKTKWALNQVLKWTQFNRVDAFGKENIMNAALKKYRRMVQSVKGQQEFSAKWGQYFEKETGALIRDLKRGDISDNVKLLMWHELADVQPIALSEMPEFYLKHPNFRLLYMLKTFTIKQLDFMRREIVSEFARGRTSQGIKKLALFAGYWQLANGGADYAKASLVGALTGQTNFDVKDEFVKNSLSLFGWSRYMTHNVGKEGIIKAGVDFLLPPVYDPFVGLFQHDVSKLVDPIPFVGRMVSKAIRDNKKMAKAIHTPNFRLGNKINKGF